MTIDDVMNEQIDRLCVMHGKARRTAAAMLQGLTQFQLDIMIEGLDGPEPSDGYLARVCRHIAWMRRLEKLIETVSYPPAQGT